MKKIISAFLAAALCTTALAATAFAEAADTSANATYCFDNGNSLPQWETYGSTDAVGFKMDISTDIKESGDGALCISESITGAIPNDQQFGGVFVTAESLGLEDFKGCTVQMSVLFDENAMDVADTFTAFSDGIVWMTTELSADTAGKWSKVSLTVPSNAANTKIGFTIPVFDEYSGNVVYIDNIIVYDADGNVVSNVGDYSVTSSSIEVSIGTGGRIALTIVLVLLILAVIGGIGFLVSMWLKRFT